MPIYVYELTSGTPQAIARLNKQIPGTITSFNVANPQTITIDTDASNKDDLDEIMSFRGFAALASEASINVVGRHDWGAFTTANEPTVNLTAGDTGFDTTLGAFVFYTGAAWQTVASGVTSAVGSFNVVDNATATVITGINTWVDLNLNASAVTSVNNSLWTLTNATTGEIRYDGTPTITPAIMASISGTGLAGQDNYEFRALLNGSPTTDGTRAACTTNTEIENVVLIDSETVSTNDLVRFQVQSTSNSDNFTVLQLSGLIR